VIAHNGIGDHRYNGTTVLIRRANQKSRSAYMLAYLLVCLLAGRFFEVVDRLHARVSEDIFTVSPTLEHAFYADQHAAIDALERLVRDESIEGSLPRFQREDVPYRRYLLDCIYGLRTDDYWPEMPRYWNWHEEFEYTFELDETVEDRIRDLVVETGFDADLPDNWTLRDLGI
jgi:hypothetical protein